MPSISPLSLVRNGEIDKEPPTSAELRKAVQGATDALIGFVEERAGSPEVVSFRTVERELRERVFAFGRVVVVLFLALREEQVSAEYRGRRTRAWGRTFRAAPANARNLVTMFGVIRYWRMYMREVAAGKRHGFHPLDRSLGLVADRFSFNVLAKAAWFATKMSFAEACSTLAEFVPNAPSTEVIEQAVLGLGRRTGAWFEQQEAPEDDGEVLVIMFDGKAAPTATERELKRRRRKRSRPSKSGSPRHRGRDKRGRHRKLARRKKGDKSKNGKVATLLIMYTLRRRGGLLEGPISRRAYGSFAPKRHVFEVARAWANKRGFPKEGDKVIQIVTDGDNDFATYSKRYFPTAIHTIDIWHVVEKLWTAGACFCKDGSSELADWVHKQKDRLFDGEAESIVDEMRRRYDLIPKTGPGNKGRRERLAEVIGYVDKRTAKMNYGELRKQDLEIASGAIEGAIKHIIGRRLDHGGMRWIKERAEALLQLRCIAINGDWQAFERYVHDHMHAEALVDCTRVRLQSRSPAPLPKLAEAA